jgi:hypothetical protein
MRAQYLAELRRLVLFTFLLPISSHAMLVSADDAVCTRIR